MATKVWGAGSGPMDSLWDTPTNWTGDSIPVDGDAVIFNGAVSAAPLFSFPSVKVFLGSLSVINYVSSGGYYASPTTRSTIYAVDVSVNESGYVGVYGQSQLLLDPFDGSGNPTNLGNWVIQYGPTTIGFYFDDTSLTDFQTFGLDPTTSYPITFTSLTDINSEGASLALFNNGVADWVYPIHLDYPEDRIFIVQRFGSKCPGVKVFKTNPSYTGPYDEDVSSLKVPAPFLLAGTQQGSVTTGGIYEIYANSGAGVLSVNGEVGILNSPNQAATTSGIYGVVIVGNVILSANSGIVWSDNYTLSSGTLALGNAITGSLTCEGNSQLGKYLNTAIDSSNIPSGYEPYYEVFIYPNSLPIDKTFFAISVGTNLSFKDSSSFCGCIGGNTSGYYSLMGSLQMQQLASGSKTVDFNDQSKFCGIINDTQLLLSVVFNDRSKIYPIKISGLPSIIYELASGTLKQIVPSSF